MSSGEILSATQIRQTKQSATVIRLDFVLAHGDGLPCRRMKLRHRPSG